MNTIDRWLAARTFHHGQFAEIKELLRHKEEQGLTLSLCIPTLNEAATIGPMVTCLRSVLSDRIPLLDEIAVIDSGSTDRTMELAAAAGASVHQAAAILPEMGSRCGKGENLWKALYQLKGDILVFLDADITNIDPRFVAGLVGPLLLHPEIGYVKSCYDRPVRQDGADFSPGGGRVTEILVRPFLSRHFPELTGFIQPLAGEYAARRTLLETVPFPIGYGVEVAHLIDLHTLHGLGVFAQTDMGQRYHRSRSNAELGRMAAAILEVLERRVRTRRLGAEQAAGGILLQQFVRRGGAYQRETFAIVEPERPPMGALAPYQQRRGLMPASQGAWSGAADTAVERLTAALEY